MTVDEKMIRDLAYRMANSKLGEGDAVRCEGPTEYEINQALPWARGALANLAHETAKTPPVLVQEEVAARDKVVRAAERVALSCRLTSRGSGYMIDSKESGRAVKFLLRVVREYHKLT